MSEKKHFFYISFVYLVGSGGGLNLHAMDVKTNNKTVNRSVLNNFLEMGKSDIFKTLSTEEQQTFRGLNFASISYLGEMTEEEFNS